MLTGEGGSGGGRGVKYNIMRNVIKFNWATELIIYFEEDTHIRKDDWLGVQKWLHYIIVVLNRYVI